MVDLFPFCREVDSVTLPSTLPAPTSSNNHHTLQLMYSRSIATWTRTYAQDLVQWKGKVDCENAVVSEEDL
ncbi:hypothetical protein Nepgr_020689 [Nepenthes gracilis]|uniref:Uncharacterized protein n=1 Tax=Nepenthes gracilis TaxID=150966 RepID=A0AAD3SWM9_NEPGR|nr:hypothetical protein Nepgr_020689 [Nepenthes gracilis]